jgi:hypothetical protein
MVVPKLGGANCNTVLAFPPAPMTGYATNMTGLSYYGQGVYVASASSEFGGGFSSAWQAFDKNIPSQWASAYIYTPNVPYSGAVATNDIVGNLYRGEWIQLQLPNSIVTTSYAISPQNGDNIPKSWYILGSKDGFNWNLVDQRVNVTAWVGYNTFQIQGICAYNFFRFICNVISVGGAISLQEIILNGTIESVNVTPDGRVGLGVVNPTRALEVAGDIVCSGTVSGGNPTMFRNALYNGDMRINQRGISTNWASPTAIGTSTTVYTVDRWNPFRNTGQTGCAVAQGTLATTDAPYSQGLQYYLRVGRVSGDTGTQLIAASYQLETRDSLRLAGQPTTVSFWYRTGSGFSGTLNINYFYATGTDQGWRIGPTLSAVILNPSFSNSNAWQYASFTAFAPLVTNQLFIGPQYTPTGTAGGFDYFDITGVQLEKGTVATPFEVRPFATELALCQRYYHRTCNTGTVPLLCPLTIISATTAEGVYKLPVTMRIVPALATSGTATLDWHTVSNNSVGGLSILTASGQSTIDNAVIIASTVGNGTAGSVTVGQTRMLMINSGFIDFSAEL